MGGRGAVEPLDGTGDPAAGRAVHRPRRGSPRRGPSATCSPTSPASRCSPARTARRATARARRAWGDGAMLDQGGVDDPAIWAVTAALAGSEAWDELGVVLDTVAAAASRAGAVLAHATRATCGRTAGWRSATSATRSPRSTGRSPRGPWAGARSSRARSGCACAACSNRATSPRPRRRSRTCPPTRRALSRLPARRGAARRPGGRRARAQRQRRWRSRRGARRARSPSPSASRTRRSSRGGRGRLAAARVGELEEAARLADEEIAAARAMQLPRTLGVALTVRGIVERPRALFWLAQAVEVLEATPAAPRPRPRPRPAGDRAARRGPPR